MKKLVLIASLLAAFAASAEPGNGLALGHDKVRPVRPGNDVQVQTQQQGQTQAQSATGIGVGIGVGGAGGNASATGGSATSSSTSSSNASGGTAQSVASSSNQGVSTTVNNVSTSPSDMTVRTVGAAPDILTTPTAPCRIAVGVSGGWIGGALGFGTSVEDEGCTLRENARLLHNFGEKAAALKLMCNDSKVAAVLTVCPAPAPQPAVEMSVAVKP